MNAVPSRRTYAITLFLILAVCYGYFMPKWADWGANSRADLTYAFGDQGVLHIDAYHTNTGDKACYPGPFTPAEDPNDKTGGSCAGHFYSDKSLGPSLLALPPYVVFRLVAGLPPVQRFIERAGSLGSFAATANPAGSEVTYADIYQYMALIFITFFATSVPSALLGVVVFLLACRFTKCDLYAFGVGLVYGLATIAFPYSNALYQHQLAAFGMFVGFFLLWRVVYEGAHLRWLWLVGVLFSFAVITEYPVVPALGIIFLWAAFTMPNRLQLYRVVLGAIPLGLIFAAYNYAIFSTPLPVGYEYSTNWQDVHQVGFLSLTIPNPQTLIGLTISPFRGIFFLSPALLLALPGFVWLWREHKALRGGIAMLAMVVVFFFMYNSSSAMWWGGHTVGPRYLTPMVPFLAVPLVAAFERAGRNRVWLAVAALLVVLAFANVWIQSISGQAWPPADTATGARLDNPLFDYSLPLFMQGNLARNYGMIAGLNGFLSLLPLALAVTLIATLLPRWLSRREQRVHMTTQKAAGGTR
jgi:hypothetical protein